jgi:hypothetical protein
MAPTWFVWLRLALLGSVVLVVLALVALVVWMLLMRRKRTPRGFDVLPPR